MRVTQIFLLCFLNSFFFVYRHSDLEGSCSDGTKTRHVNLVVAGKPSLRDLTLGCTIWNIYGKKLLSIRCVLGRSGLRVVSLSPCFRGVVGVVKYCCNRCSSILAFETSS